jgi:ACS family glucarate transporter-like MFS transporter
MTPARAGDREQRSRAVKKFPRAVSSFSSFNSSGCAFAPPRPLRYHPASHKLNPDNALHSSSAQARWWVIFLLLTGTFINAIDRASLSTAAPNIMADLRLDPAMMGIALSAFFWSYIILNIPAGGLADRFGAKRTLGWAAALWSLASAFTGVASRALHVVLARLGVGAGEAASFPVNARIVTNRFPPEQRGIAVGFYTAGLRLGFALTPVLMAALISTSSWRFAFYLTGLGSLLWVILWYFTYHETQTEPKAARAVSGIPWKQLLANRTALGLVLCKFFQDYLFYLFVTWLPAYLIMDRGFTLMKMGWCASLPWIAGAFAQPLMGWLSDKLIRRGVSVTVSRKTTIITMQLLAAGVVITGSDAPDAMTAVWLLTLAVACESASTSILWAACTDVAPPAAAGSFAGVMNTAGALAGILAPVVTGFFVQVTGSFEQALLIGSCMVVLAAFSIWFIVGELKPIPLRQKLATNDL